MQRQLLRPGRSIARWRRHHPAVEVRVVASENVLAEVSILYQLYESLSHHICRNDNTARLDYIRYIIQDLLQKSRQNRVRAPCSDVSDFRGHFGGDPGALAHGAGFDGKFNTLRCQKGSVLLEASVLGLGQDVIEVFLIQAVEFTANREAALHFWNEIAWL